MECRVLSNGLRVVLIPKNLNTVAIVIASNRGSRTETVETNGIGHIIEHIIARCSQKYPTIFDVEKVMDRVGGDYDPETTPDLIWWQISFHRRHLALAMDMIADNLLHPIISKEVVQREKGVILTEIANKSPDIHSLELLDGLIFKGHPLSFFPGGTAENIERLSLRDVRNHWRRVIRANNLVFVAVGGFDEKKLFENVKEKLGSLRPGIPTPINPFLKTQRRRRILFQTTPGEQAKVLVGITTVKYGHRDRVPLKLISNILGERTSSRLHTKLRDRGLVYRALSNCWHWFDTGCLYVQTATRKEDIVEVVNTIVGELRDLCENLVSIEEIDLAKSNINALVRESLDYPLSIARSYAGQLIAHGEIKNYRDYLTGINAVSRRRLREVARRRFKTNKLNLVVYGDTTPEIQRAVRETFHI